MLLQPGSVTLIGVFLNLAQQLNRFCFVARFTGIIGRDDHFYLDRDDVPFRLDQASAFDALTGNAHA